MRRILLLLSAFAASGLVAAGLARAASGVSTTTTFTVHMTGGQEVPKGSPTGSGTAVLSLTPSTGRVCFHLTWSKIDTPIASHIHKAPKGKAGAVVVPLFSTPPAKHSGCVSAAKSLVAAILKHPSDYYVNIHTKRYPNGAIRGQL